MTKLFALLILVSFLFAVTDSELSMDTKGQVSLIHVQSFDSGFQNSLTNLHYIPEFRVDYQMKSELRLGMDAALDVYNYSIGDSLMEFDAATYRLSVRYDSPNTQVRLGLQKINFGPAKMLRVLQWFDQLDVRDPLALSSGVWAGLGRHYFDNGTDLRLWVMAEAPNSYRDNLQPIDDKPLDIGGRFEYPLPQGTLGLTVHQLDLKEVSGITETRAALDFRMDAVLGIWSESMISRVNISTSQMDIMTVMGGLDYTFGIGNGLYVAFEGLTNLSGAFDDAMSWQLRSLALMSNYTFGLSDALVAYLYVIETPISDVQILPALGWSHTQGNWMIYLALYDMPEELAGGRMTQPVGTGFQFNLAYNH